jgi:hypothetical protein
MLGQSRFEVKVDWLQHYLSSNTAAISSVHKLLSFPLSLQRVSSWSLVSHEQVTCLDANKLVVMSFACQAKQKGTK